MITPGDNPWFAKTPAEILAAIDARPEKSQVIGTFRGRQFSRYQVSDKGAIRGPNGILSTRDNGGGYRLTDIRDDDGKRLTCTVHTLVLAKFDPRCKDGIPAGMETRHGPAGPGCNAWPENLDIGSKIDNARDKPEPGGGPQFPCRNAGNGCRNRVINEGRRCQDCVTSVGCGAAARLTAGEPLEKVAAWYGNSEAWIYRLAVEHGGYEGTIAQARQPAGRWAHEMCDCPGCVRRRRGPWWHRVMVTLRAHLYGGDSA